MNNKIIFWDMDETLGFFRHFSDYETLEEVPKENNKSLLKSGIEELLQELSAEGFTHHVTTSGIESYAKIALEATDIRKYFGNVYAREEICPLKDGYYENKNYNVPLKDLGLAMERAKSDVLIIGNSKDSDVPHNIRGIVSIIEEDNWIYKSELTKKIIYMLITNGQGDFNKGFHKLYTDSGKINSHHKIVTDENVELRLELREYTNGQTPILTIEKADWYDVRNWTK